MSNIKYIPYEKANRALNGFHYLRPTFVMLCLISFVSTAYCQSEFLFKDQNAVSVGGALTRTLNDSNVHGINRTLGLVVSAEGVLDVGWTISKNSRRTKVVPTFFVSVNLGESKRKLQRSGVSLFGLVSENRTYAFGAQQYYRKNTSKSFFLVPQAQGGVTSSSTGRFSRDTRWFWGVGLSLGFGSGKSPLFVLTPALSKIRDTPLRIGISATLLALFPDKPIKKN